MCFLRMLLVAIAASWGLTSCTWRMEFAATQTKPAFAGFKPSFATVLERVAESILPELYSHYVDVAVTLGELEQLLESNLSGPSHKFIKTGLGILELDAGKYMPTCSGDVTGTSY